MLHRHHADNEEQQRLEHEQKARSRSAIVQSMLLEFSYRGRPADIVGGNAQEVDDEQPDQRVSQRHHAQRELLTDNERSEAHRQRR